MKISTEFWLVKKCKDKISFLSVLYKCLISNLWEQIYWFIFLLVHLPNHPPHTHRVKETIAVLDKMGVFLALCFLFLTRPSLSATVLAAGDGGIKTNWNEGQIDFSTWTETSLLEWSQRRKEIHVKSNLFSLSVSHGETTFSASSVLVCLHVYI